MKYNIIIFEGIDGTGKTNISKELSKRINYKYLKFKPESNRWFDPEIDLIYGVRKELFYLKEFNLKVILDRHFPSEYVYSQVYNRPFLEKLLRKVDLEFKKLKTLIIICVKNIKNYEDELLKFDDETYKKIKDKFVEFSKWTKCNVILFDTTNEDLENQMKRILNYLKK